MRGGEARRPSDGQTDELIDEKERKEGEERGKRGRPIRSFFATILLRPTAAFRFGLGLPSTYLPSASPSGLSHTQRGTCTHTAVGSSSNQTQLLLSVSGASEPISALLQINYGLSAWIASVISLSGSRSDGLS